MLQTSAHLKQSLFKPKAPQQMSTDAIFAEMFFEHARCFACALMERSLHLTKMLTVNLGEALRVLADKQQIVNQWPKKLNRLCVEKLRDCSQMSLALLISRALLTKIKLSPFTRQELM
jgi:hypothetical protein